MAEESPSGQARLRTSGMGVIGGGSILAVAAAIGPFWLAAAFVIALGGVGLIAVNGTSGRQGSVGVLAVGAIGLLEALPGIGLGLDPATLSALAIAFGCFDVAAGLVLDRLPSADNRS